MTITNIKLNTNTATISQQELRYYFDLLNTKKQAEKELKAMDTRLMSLLNNQTPVESGLYSISIQSSSKTTLPYKEILKSLLKDKFDGYIAAIKAKTEPKISLKINVKKAENNIQLAA